MSFQPTRPGLSSVPLQSVTAAVVDTETTGLDTASDRVIEIAAVEIADGTRQANTFAELIAPGVPISPRSTEIHGITDADVAGCRGYADVIGDFAAWAGARLIIGYSIGFDLGILRAEHERNGMDWVPPRALDVRHLMQIVGPALPEQSLDTTAEWLGIEVSNRHRALGDAEITAQVFLALLPKLRDMGITTLAQAERASQDLSERLGNETRIGWHEMAGPTTDPVAILARVDSYPYRHRVAKVMTAPPVRIDGSRDLAAALAEMIETGISSVFVELDGANGILTERDILRAVNAHGAEALGMNAGAFAGRPLVTIESQEFVYRAITRMTSGDFRHLGVTDTEGNLIGALSTRDLLKQRAGDAMSLGDIIDAAETPAELGRIWASLTTVAGALVHEGVDPRNIAAIISREMCALTARATVLGERQLAEQGMGAAPAAYTMLVLGSGGRGESLLAMDQDNAIVFSDGEPGGDTDTWFKHLGVYVADTLNDAGVRYCNGGIMAKNAAWRMNTDLWRERVGGWIRDAKSEDILNSDIFFDAAAVHGDFEMGRILRLDAMKIAGDNQKFLKIMADKAGDFRNAVGMFGRIRAEDGRIDLKKSGIMPIFSTARVLALQCGIDARSTPGRLAAARDLDIRGAHIIDNLIEAHRIMLGMILRQQLRDIDAGVRHSNKVRLTDLDAHDKQELKWALDQSSAIYDVLGTPARM